MSDFDFFDPDFSAQPTAAGNPRALRARFSPPSAFSDAWAPPPLVPEEREALADEGALSRGFETDSDATPFPFPSLRTAGELGWLWAGISP